MQKRKTTILFICPYPHGKAPSQRFRFEQYFNQLNNAGFDFHVSPFFSEKTWSILYQQGKILQKLSGIFAGYISRIIILFTLSKYDYVFIHREATPLGPPIFEFFITFGFRKKIIYDFDDAIWLTNTSQENWLASKLKWHRKVKAICQWSYKVSCGNEYLCHFAGQFTSNVFLNPTTIDTNNLHTPLRKIKNQNSAIITIGWTGTHSTLKYLNWLEPIINSLEKKFPNCLRFLVIADKVPSLKIKCFEFMPWSKDTEIDDLLLFDIGVMPLTNDEWAKGKCGFKALQYMALGIPVVASPVGVNLKIIEQGEDGYLCDNQTSWESTLEKLILDSDHRIKIGKCGRKKVINHYSVLSNTSNFLSLFQ
jgi:glycosyltransferase involved in cell wall biosynthesis